MFTEPEKILEQAGVCLQVLVQCLCYRLENFMVPDPAAIIEGGLPGHPDAYLVLLPFVLQLWPADGATAVKHIMSLW